MELSLLIKQKKRNIFSKIKKTTKFNLILKIYEKYLLSIRFET